MVVLVNELASEITPDARARPPVQSEFCLTGSDKLVAKRAGGDKFWRFENSRLNSFGNSQPNGVVFVGDRMIA